MPVFSEIDKNWSFRDCKIYKNSIFSQNVPVMFLDSVGVLTAKLVWELGDGSKNPEIIEMRVLRFSNSRIGF